MQYFIRIYPTCFLVSPPPSRDHAFSLIQAYLMDSAIRKDGRKDGWMDDLGFYAHSSVFQSYQDNGQMIMKGCVHWNPVYG